MNSPYANHPVPSKPASAVRSTLLAHEDDEFLDDLSSSNILTDDSTVRSSEPGDEDNDSWLTPGLLVDETQSSSNFDSAPTIGKKRKQLTLLAHDDDEDDDDDADDEKNPRAVIAATPTSPARSGAGLSAAELSGAKQQVSPDDQ